MAPTTRNSGNFGTGHSSNLDHILDNFNQFKRKHIVQNRDIIKTNALAQLRIKELEEKVLELEGERAEKNLEMIRIRANMDRFERATKAVMRGWQLVGAGLAAMAAVDGFHVAEASDRAEGEAREILHSDDAKQTKQGTRIVLNPHALPGGVARGVARAPDAQLNNLTEEDDSRDATGRGEDDSQAGVETLEAEDTMMLDEAHETVQSEEETIRHIVQEHTQKHWQAAVDPTNSAASVLTAPVASSSGSHVQSSHLYIAKMEQDSEQPAALLHRATSVDSLSSFADDEEIQLSDDVDDIVESEIALMDSMNDVGASRMADIIREERPTKTRKRRESTMSPDRSDVHDSTSSSYRTGFASSSDSESPQMVRTSRRSSARDRRSINYALPKLNTKMRKPDPADLIPAHGGEMKRTDTDPGSGMSDNSREVTPRRTLKGGKEVASSGNLRDIRKLHQSARGEGSDDAAQMTQKSGPLTRRRSSNGMTPSSLSTENRSSKLTDEQSQDDQSSDEDTADLGSSLVNSSSSSAWSKASSAASTNRDVFKPALQSTPLPRNQTGQKIKALKVANRIQKTIAAPHSFSSDDRRVTGKTWSATNDSGGARPLTTSAKTNQSKGLASGADAKRNGLHAAMTERED